MRSKVAKRLRKYALYSHTRLKVLKKAWLATSSDGRSTDDLDKKIAVLMYGK